MLYALHIDGLESYTLETVIRGHMIDYLETNHLLTNYQHGFTQLHETIDTLSNNIDKGEQQEIIYLDFQKAFDSVSHNRLISKKIIGFHSQIVNWVKDFLEIENNE